MTKREKQYVDTLIEFEGFDYGLSNWDLRKEVKDERYHELREAWLTARKALMDYAEVDA